MQSLILSLIIATIPALAEQGSNFNVSPETAQSYGCGAMCYQILQTTNALDLADVGSDFDFDFYEVADNFTTSKPGDLLKLKPVDPTTLKDISGVSVYRIQYVSEDLNGTYVPATGFIALPYSLPDTGAFPLVAYAHGTIGTYHGCAVSNGPDLYDYNSWTLLSERGYAVVATDYAGLGPSTPPHKYCAFPAHAADIFHSVRAARIAFGRVLTRRWLAVGHSQGGGAVWKLAEDIDALALTTRTHDHHDHRYDRARLRDLRSYRGAVALAPATKVWDMALLAEQLVFPREDMHAWAVAGLAPLLGPAVRSVYPQFNVSSVLAPAMVRRLGLVGEAGLCVSGVLGLTLDLDVDELVAPSVGMAAADREVVERWQREMAPAMGGAGAGAKGEKKKVRARGPILVVQGVNDTAILAEQTVRSWRDACEGGSEVHLRLYPKQDHSGVVVAAAPDWLRWVEARFAGVHTPGRCTKVTKRPFDYDFVRAELEVDPSALE
ncbi:hypothetical protein DBV05_g12067 [Lasiodiplodia theobromae]|uniref:Serine aminopeptidase S33 domain-containing protein n=1 Tax=Lasiodiplodia theobromae TaxID=45133 RepID=A0A5N5CV96_9PEZI|nr:hypothetical protein DBV05_g12067 [Lasiodiplodia theobromae]